ncbi:MAG: serine hydrolase [gamma proteobacterium symbiont of Bathyaustriella thionipta]|nr:serine hydrolase [gamma proteobacterium symbiont of Bathyaustriella thionipta]
MSQDLFLRSTHALLINDDGKILFERKKDDIRPIASVTKLMSAMVILDGKQALDELVEITKADRDLLQLTGSRLKFGARLKRAELLKIMLMSSENRAALALGRNYNGGLPAMVKAMNRKARALGMRHSHFSDPAGLSPENTSTASDLAIMVKAARHYSLITEASHTRSTEVFPWKKKGALTYRNTNRLLKRKDWHISVSKTGFITEAGRCLVMQANINQQALTIVLLNSYGKLSPFGDSNRIRKWLAK